MDVVVNVSKDCEAAFCKRFPECNAVKRVIYNPIDRVKIDRMAGEYEIDRQDNVLTVITVGRVLRA